MKIQFVRHFRNRAGFALLMVLVLLAISFMVLSATMSRTTTNAKLIDRNNAYISSTTAAEASTEKALALLLADYQNGAEARIIANLANYQNAVPTTNENAFWANFTFTDAQGHANKNYVARTSLATNSVFVSLSEQYTGLSGFSSNYRIIANVTPANSPYAVTAAVQQDIQVAEIPVFQFAVFYGGLMEYTWCAPFTVTGRVHCNSNIYVGSSGDLTFSYPVTAVGTITNIAWDGHTQAEYTGKVKYNGSPSPGFDTGYNSLNLPIGTTNTPDAVREIINLPAFGEDMNSAIGQQRYYNKAGMVILVSDTNINVTMKNSPGDLSPLTFTSGTTNWTNVNFNFFLATNQLFYDQRNGQYMKTTQLDVGKMKTWMGTNASLSTKFDSSNPLSVIYVADLRSTNSTTNTAVRLMDGATLPTNGLTVATINPLYIWGHYNCPSNAFLGTTNTTASVPASVAADALTLLSPSWADSDGTLSLGSPSRAASDMTVNTAIIAGIVYTTGSTSSTFSGGVMNLPRLLESWSGNTLTLNTSIVNMYNSVRATAQFQNPGVYYNAPNLRKFNFDQNYTQSGKLPPGTPRIRRLIRASFCNPPPNNVTYVPQPTDFVPE